MSKTGQIVEKIVVTFFEGAGAYLIVIPTVNWNKTVLSGAAAAGISLVYNVLRQSTPTIPQSTPPAVTPPTVIQPAAPAE
jgi:hypothetical protein